MRQLEDLISQLQSIDEAHRRRVRDLLYDLHDRNERIAELTTELNEFRNTQEAKPMSGAELDALPVGTKIAYRDQPESFILKLADGRWRFYFRGDENSTDGADIWLERGWTNPKLDTWDVIEPESATERQAGKGLE